MKTNDGVATEQSFRWKLESDSFVGCYWLLPYMIVTPPNVSVFDENFWTFGAGWLRWGFTLSVGRMLNDR